MTLKKTSAQVVETLDNVISNSPSQDYTHPDDRTLLNYDTTPGFKPFTIYGKELYVFSLKRVPNRVFGIRDLAFLEPGIRDSKGIWERDSRNRHFEAPRSGISDGEKLKTQLSPLPTTETTGNKS